MNAADDAVVDLAFDVTGTALPVDYEFGLWRELVRCLPWLEGAPAAGMHPLRTSPGGEGRRAAGASREARPASARGVRA